MRTKKMTNERFLELVKESFEALENNCVTLSGEDVTLQVLEAPLTGFAAADDPLFEQYRDPEVIGPEFRTPAGFLPEAKSVVGFFFPFTEEVRRRVRMETGLASPTWKAAYGTNSIIVDTFLDDLVYRLEEEGVRAVQPNRAADFERKTVLTADGEDVHFSVSWSNRHAMYAAGLGTFGTHRHIITEKGCCGTTASFITDADLAPTKREYTGIYEWCIHCGECSDRCPVGAIPKDGLRNLRKCSAHGGALREQFGGFCGKCLTAVPCEDRAPARPE
jgi:epoxyqueuosine reductase QueG